MTENTEILFDMLFTTEFNATELRESLGKGHFTPDEVNTAAYLYVDKCTSLMDEKDFEPYAPGELIPGIESSHLAEALSILLDYGLDPNFIYNDGCENNIIRTLGFVSNGYQSADALLLLFEHGGNPELTLDGERVVDCDLGFDFGWFLFGDIESRYIADSYMHYWMVFVGCGAKWESGQALVKTFGSFKSFKWSFRKQQLSAADN